MWFSNAPSRQTIERVWLGTKESVCWPTRRTHHTDGLTTYPPLSLGRQWSTDHHHVLASAVHLEHCVSVVSKWGPVYDAGDSCVMYPRYHLSYPSRWTLYTCRCGGYPIKRQYAQDSPQIVIFLKLVDHNTLILLASRMILHDRIGLITLQQHLQRTTVWSTRTDGACQKMFWNWYIRIKIKVWDVTIRPRCPLPAPPYRECCW